MHHLLPRRCYFFLLNPTCWPEPLLASPFSLSPGGVYPLCQHSLSSRTGERSSESPREGGGWEMRAHWNLKGGNLWIPTFLPTLVQGQVCTRFVTPGSYSLMPSPTKQLLSVHSAGPCPCGARSVSQEVGMSAGKQDAEWWDTCWRFPVSSIQEEEPGNTAAF